MPSPNPFFALQQRLADLLEANAYFTGLTAKKALLTEQIGDLEFQVSNVVLPQGFGVVVTTAAGKAVENSYGALLSDEDLNISIIHNPKTLPGKNALDAQWAAIQAVQGQTVHAAPPHVLTERDYFRIVGHQRR